MHIAGEHACHILYGYVRGIYADVVKPLVSPAVRGEKFIISLSLALALSGMRGEGKICDMLFIDEGFGSLSNDKYLDVVVECLQRLYQVSGQKVVIISHVESLRDRIPVQIQVRKNSGGTASRVVVAG